MQSNNVILFQRVYHSFLASPNAQIKAALEKISPDPSRIFISPLPPLRLLVVNTA